MEKTIGQTVKVARLALGFSQSKFAEQYGISRSQLYFMEKGKTKKPYLTTLKKLSKAPNLDFEELKRLCGYVHLENGVNMECNSTKGKKTIGQTIKEARIALGLSQNQFNELYGFSANQLYLIENEKVKKPRLSTLEIFANALNLDFEELKELCNYS